MPKAFRYSEITMSEKNKEINILFFHALIGVTIAILACVINRYSISLVTNHFLILLSIYTISISLCLVLSRIKSSDKHSLYYSLIFALPATFITLLYCGNFFSNYHWKGNLSYILVYNNILSLYREFGPAVYLLIAIVIALFVSVWTFIYYKYFNNKHVFTTSNSLIRSYLWFFMGAFLLASIILGHQFFRKHDLGEYYAGEAFADFFMPHSFELSSAFSADKKGLNNLSSKMLQQPDRSKKNIILIVADSLRKDHLSLYGYNRKTTPYLNAFIAPHEKYVIKNAVSTCNESSCGIVSLLSSNFNPDSNSVYPNNLPSLMRENGYQVNLLLSADHSFGDLDHHYSPYDIYIDGRDFENYSMTDDRGVLDALDQWPDYSGTANFFYLHLMSSHLLGKQIDNKGPFTNRSNSEGFLSSLFKQLTDKDYHINKYDNRVSQFDLVLKNSLETLGSKGYLDNALIIITSDHGERLGEDGEYGHVKSVSSVDLNIPLIFVNTSPKRLDIKETYFATQFDIVPTIAKDLNTPPKPLWKGRALQEKIETPYLITHYIPDRSKTFGKTLYLPKEKQLYRYISKDLVTSTAQDTYLYELNKDGSEEINLLDIDKNRANQLIQNYRVNIP